MTADQIGALNGLHRRLSHTCAIARLVANAADGAPPDVVYALRGISTALESISDQLDEIVPLPGSAT